MHLRPWPSEVRRHSYQSQSQKNLIEMFVRERQFIGNQRGEKRTNGQSEECQRNAAARRCPKPDELLYKCSWHFCLFEESENEHRDVVLLLRM